MKDLLKFLTCGSVDDGKSTLIGHMLYDAKLIFADQKQALELDSQVGSNDGKIDYSLLLDGLMAEREQGITIDVAYRYFTSDNRSFIVADSPGHEQYTRNMAVGAAFADLAVILVDATKGVIQQTKRHSRICSLMGIRHAVLAINKMDLVDYDEKIYNTIHADFEVLCQELNFDTVYSIPVSATEGDNLTVLSKNTPWYKGQPLLPFLENIDVSKYQKIDGFLLPVQRVSRPNRTFRGFQGEIASGSIKIGDPITVYPENEKSKVKSILVGDKNVEEAFLGQPVTVQLEDEIDVSRGSVLASGREPIVADLFTSTLLWMDNERLVEGRSYHLKIGTKTINATIMDIKYRIDIHSSDHIPAEYLEKNEIASVDIATTDRIVFEKFEDNEALGGFILIDKVSNMTSACGVVEHALRRSDNVSFEKMDVTKEIRAEKKGQKPIALWFTGLSSAGKSTLANALEKKLVSLGKHTMVLDGNNIRKGLNHDLGFDEPDRIENIRRVAEVVKLMNDAGLITISAFISPYESDRITAHEIIGDEFIEIYVSTPLEVCESRDVRGLYKKARNGEIPNFTGISSPYEVPKNPDFVIDTSNINVEDSISQIMKYLDQYL